MQDRLNRILAIAAGQRSTRFVLLALLALLLIMPHALRYSYDHNIPFGRQPYMEADTTEMLQEDGLWRHGYSLEKMGPQNLVLLASSALFGMEFSLKLLPFMLGLISYLLVWLIMDRYRFDERSGLVFCSLLILSPLFIYNFTVFNKFTVMVPLLLGFIVLVRMKSMMARAILVCMMLVMPAFGPETLVVIFACMIIFSKYLESIKERSLLPEMIVYAVFGIIYLMSISSVDGMFAGRSTLDASFLETNLVMFGAMTGFTIFGILLFAAGIISTWKMKHRHYHLYLIILTLALAAVFLDPLFKILLGIIVSYYSALGFLSILRRSWSLKLVSDLTLATLLLGLVIIPVNYDMGLSMAEPGPDMVKSLIWLKENSQYGDTVMSHPENGYWLRYFTSNEIFVGMESRNHGARTLPGIDDFDTILQSRDLELILSFLEENDVRYIHVDPQLRRMMHVKNLPGLLFVLENSQNFNMVQEFGDIEIWKVESYDAGT